METSCSGLYGRLYNVVNFKCRTCLNPTVANDDDKKIRLGNVEYDVVDQFCYLGDMLRACGCADWVCGFGHVERVNKENPVHDCRFTEVGCQRGIGRPCKTWTQLINHDLRKLRLQPGLAQNRMA